MANEYDITHGPGGLWEVFQWNADFELNTQDGPDRILIERISGLHALPDRDESTSPKVGRIGENLYPVSPSGKTVTIEGQVQASTLKLLRQSRTEFLAAFADTTTYGTMDLRPWAGVYGDSSPTARFYARVLALEIGPEENTSDQFYRPFILSLRLIDPRVYFLALAVDSTGNPVSVTNTGNAPVDPVLHVATASGTVTVSDGTHTLTFLNVPSGTLDIDFLARTAAVGATAVELDVPNSDWWDSHISGIAGSTTVSIAQTGGASVRCVFIPADWG